MGWKGTMRSIAAAARAAEKEAQRKQKQMDKEQALSEAATAVEEWEAYIRDLVSLHTELVEKIDWQTIANKPSPSQPKLISKNKDIAEKALANFKPSLWNAFRGGSKKLRADLVANLDEALALDEKEYRAALAAHELATKEWEDDTELARKLLQGDGASIRQVISEMQSVFSTHLIGTSIEFAFDQNFVHSKLLVHDKDIVPDFRRKLLASGRLSETKMPVGQSNELYQDYVVSAAIKVAGDLFNILPLDEVYVTCEANMLNSSSGYMEHTPILSVHFVRDNLFRLNLEKIDPSNAMVNFRHEMSFSKNRGFSSINPLV